MSATLSVPDVHRLLSLTTSVLAYAEQSRQSHNGEQEFLGEVVATARTVIMLQQRLVEALGACVDGDKGEAVRSPGAAAEARMVVELSAHVQGALLLAQGCLRAVFSRAPNYFGVFDIETCARDLGLVNERLDELHRVWGRRARGSGECAQEAMEEEVMRSLAGLSVSSTFEASGAADPVAARDDDGCDASGAGGGVTPGTLPVGRGGRPTGARPIATSTGGRVEAMLADVWWCRHFGRDAVTVTWDAFLAAFTKDYGDVHPGNVLKLRRCLVMEDGRLPAGDPAPAYSWSVVQERKTLVVESDAKTDSEERGSSSRPSSMIVRVDAYNNFTAPSRSVHDAYQCLIDPCRIVYVCGRVGGQRAPQSEFRYTRSLLGVPVVQVSCGGQHACALTCEGYVYSWGRGSFGRLGHGNDEDVGEPLLIKRLETMRIKQVACGFAYTAAVTSAGELYAWGAGESGRLGNGNTADQLVPTLVQMGGKRVSQVFAGSVHTCILAEGHVYSCGRYEYTGHGEDKDVTVPTKLDKFGGKQVSQISVGPGGYHTIALTVTGEVYTWGHNRVGQLGYDSRADAAHNGNGSAFQPCPCLVESLTKMDVCQVVAGWGHSAVLLRSGEVLMCGRNHQAQLGMGDPSTFPLNERNHHYQSTFAHTRFPTHVRIVQVGCGGEHSAAIADNGDVYAFGHNVRGQLGFTHSEGEDKEIVPRLVTRLSEMRRPCLQVACGNDCTILLTSGFRVPSLSQLCIETVASMPDILQQLDYLQFPEAIDSEIRARRRARGGSSSGAGGGAGSAGAAGAGAASGGLTIVVPGVGDSTS